MCCQTQPPALRAFLHAAFPTAQPRGTSTALFCFPVENIQNIPYQPTMVQLGRQDHLLHSISTNKQIQRKHPAPPELLKDSGSRGGDLDCGSASFHLCPWLAEAPGGPCRQKTHQKNMIYYYEKTNKTQLCHSEALPEQEVQGVRSPCHDVVPAWMLPA